MKYVIWGAGLRGKRLLSHLKNEDVIAFVDKNEEKAGSIFQGKEVISLQKFAEQYSDAILVIAHVYEQEAIKELKALGIACYMCLSDCPGELQGDSTSLYLKNYLKSMIHSDARYGIWGCTVYALELYSWLSDWGNKNSCLIIEKNTKPELVRMIKQSGYQVVPEEEVCSQGLDCVLNCKRLEKDHGIQIYDGIEQKDIYDCSDFIPEYYNAQIKKLNNVNKGKRCVIVATGPSLKVEDLDKLASGNIMTIGVNNIGYAYASTRWRPTYYVGIDKALIESEYFDTIKPEEQCEYSFVSDLSEEFWEKYHKENILKIHSCNIWPLGWYPEFSEDLSRKVYISGTVVYMCIQLAVYLGFAEIYLLGTDFTGVNNYGSKYGHFYDEKDLDSVCYTDQVKLGYEKAKQYADCHGIKIFNATRGGNLEIFERVDFDSLFQ